MFPFTVHTEDIPTWDLASLYASPSDPSIEAELGALAPLSEVFAGRYATRVRWLSPADLAEALLSYETLLAAIYKPQMYASLLIATASLDDRAKALNARVGEVSTEALNRVRFFDLELSSAPSEVLGAWRASPELSVFSHYLQRSVAAAPHLLSAEVESAIATKNLSGRRAFTQLYDEVTAAWRFTFERDGAPESLNLAQLRALRADPDRGVRLRATSAIVARFRAESPLFSFILNTVYQDHRSESVLRRYASPVSQTLLDDELDAATLEALMTAVEGHYPVARKYYQLKAQALGLPKLSMCDVLAPYPQAEHSVSWERARSEVLGAFRELDPGVSRIAEGFFTDRRIDALPREGKRDGAFCAGMIPGREPCVLMNFTGTLHDVLTLAHELGHGVHFSLAAKKQRLLNYWPTTPMAETASVFAEMVLTRKLLATATDREIRRQLLATRIEEALGTIHRQVCFTRYEMNAHARRAEGVIPVSELCGLWRAEHQKLMGDAVERSDDDGYGWAAISHLVHYRFYCYSYAFGQLLVFALYRKWEEDGGDFVPKYIELLSGGGGDTPSAMLSRVGIDITDPDFWRRGLEVVTRMVDEFQSEV